jgi:starch synthase
MSKVLMVASEAVPFAKSGGLGDVLGALPPAPAECGVPFLMVDCPELYDRAELYGRIRITRSGLPCCRGVGMVTRLAAQKGLDLLEEAAEELVQEDLYLVVLGSGEPRYEERLLRLAAEHPDNVWVRIAYDNALAHKIEAGADMFLMPSHYEPCGLNQIYSLRYGTVPIVRATGGLDDTIDETTGFKFSDYTAGALLGAVRKALAACRDKEEWRAMMVRGMGKDYSWAASAREYSELYRRVMSGG